MPTPSVDGDAGVGETCAIALDHTRPARARVRCRARSRPSSAPRWSLTPAASGALARQSPSRGAGRKLRDEDAGELEEAVAGDEFEEAFAITGAEHQPADRAEQDPVLDQHRCGQQPEGGTPGERENGDLDVVGKDRRRERRLLRRREVRPWTRRLGRWLELRGYQPDSRARCSKCPAGREQRRPEEERECRDEGQPAARRPAASSRERRT